MIKTKSFENKSLDDLGISICNFQNKNNLVSKGSLPFYNSDKKVYGVLSFFNIDNNNKEQIALFSNSIINKEKPIKKPYGNCPTEKQAWRLNKMGYNDVDISNMTFEKAKNIINAFMKNKLNKDSETEEDIYL